MVHANKIGGEHSFDRLITQRFDELVLNYLNMVIKIGEGVAEARNVNDTRNNYYCKPITNIFTQIHVIIL